ncbi:MAG: Queuosine biosynthesis protein [Ilumatobacteraceae bacterium]|nr:Queuosine biosynthesis protein [Ilumatobacteraceae bacterium]
MTPLASATVGVTTEMGSPGRSAPDLGTPLPLGFTLDAAHEAHEPPEARGTVRDGVRLMVSPGTAAPVHTTFDQLPAMLAPGDLIVANTSGTVAAAVDVVLDDGTAIVLHVSTELPGGLWMVEPRDRLASGSTRPLRLAPAPNTAHVDERSAIHLLRPAPGSDRLWLAVPDAGTDVPGTLRRHGRPIRYPYVPDDWPLDAYQTVFASQPGSAEMPSASRPFTDHVVTRLVAAGIGLATITLHTGVSSLEGHELPYAERFQVPATTAAVVNAVHAAGGHVIAAGTTVVRALETATDAQGRVHPADGWTDTVITPARGVRAVDGLITGWHEPEATHLAMLEAVAGRDALLIAYREAFEHGYLWHEFGDSHLLLPYADRP